MTVGSWIIVIKLPVTLMHFQPKVTKGRKAVSAAFANVNASIYLGTGMQGHERCYKGTARPPIYTQITKRTIATLPQHPDYQSSTANQALS